MAYEPRAIAHTDATRIDAELRRQRHRWIRGGIQSLRKHKSMVGNRSLGLIGLFWMPIWLLGYLMQAGSLVAARVTPVLMWSTGVSSGYLPFLGLWIMVASAINAAMVVSGLAAWGRQDLRLRSDRQTHPRSNFAARCFLYVCRHRLVTSYLLRCMSCPHHELGEDALSRARLRGQSR
jgi:cellulose synthase/poly-beta-1,6-N-acetylglucosamine synthase-like glycosyltransferase